MAHTSIEHAVDAAAFIENQERTHWHDQALWFVRAKRDKAARAVPEWEQLRTLAGQIKRHTIAAFGRLPGAVRGARGAVTASTCIGRAMPTEHNQIVLDILQRHQVRKVVKSKSMLTEECHLNPYLEQHGIEVVDTDLGERIVQLRQEPPSHIVLPAIHIKKEEVGATFHEHLGTRGRRDGSELPGGSGPRTSPREVHGRRGGDHGCEFRGGGDRRHCRLHERRQCRHRRVPAAAAHRLHGDREADSAVGGPGRVHAVAGAQRHGPAGDDVHVAFSRTRAGWRTALRAGRQRSRARSGPSDAFRESLCCIRCGACLNTCPVYRRSGGYSYHATIPGPDRLRAQCGPGRPGLSLACPMRAVCADRVPMSAR